MNCFVATNIPIMASSCRASLRTLQIALLIFGLLITCSESARITRAVMMDMDKSINCISGTIMERNSSASIILTGTVKNCEKMRPQKYSCTVQIWRIMKGENIADDLLQRQDDEMMKTMHMKSLVEVYGLGNKAFCESEVKEDKTRIFFLNRVGDHVVLAASLLHITLQNLENTEKVVKGIKIVETPKKPPDPCLYVLCGFGAKCEASDNGTATCICPKVTCGKSPDSSNMYAPVCGSDGVTYPSECRLKAAQCWSQRRIRIASRFPCAADCNSANALGCNSRHDDFSTRRPDIAASVITSPIQEGNPCKGVICGHWAKCVVENGEGRCQCSSCDHIITRPVCGSNQITYRTECDLQRASCMKALTIDVVRRTACEPCMVYNKTTKSFERTCNGSCILNDDFEPLCCSDIPCEPSSHMLCGSDGRTYMSKCAMQRYACKSGKDITEVSKGNCPVGRDSTVIRGSTSIAADENCPGGCRSGAPEFVTFKNSFEKAVRANLNIKNNDDDDGRAISDFNIEEVRNGSATIVYSARITWSDKAIDKDFTPGEDSLWAYHRLHDPSTGVFMQVINAFGVIPVTYKNPEDDFITEEICGSMQCTNSASCRLSKDSAGGFLHDCDCSVIGDSKRLPVTLGCKIANNNRFYENKIAAKLASCATRSFLTFRDICIDPPHSLCDDIQCGVGRTCIITNGVANCECTTCEDEFSPVCGSNHKIYRSRCELERENCVEGRSVDVINEGMCTSANICGDVYCRGGGQCEVFPLGKAECICPENCVDVYVPVCGSDGVTYENECKMNIASCNKKTEITVLHRDPCDGSELVTPPVIPTEEPEGSGDILEGSGEPDECGCHFGATCEATIDDEDGKCICNIQCSSSGIVLCGSDGLTYFDECDLKKARCAKQQNITIVNKGACREHCSKSEFGCCEDGITPAGSRRKAGCPEICQCDMHGSFSPFCSTTTGQCVCRPGVGGWQCDECLPGYWNFEAITKMTSIGCMRCHCHPDGSIRDDCDSMTGQCTCKEGVVGVKCSLCANGETLTKDGCVKDPAPLVSTSCNALNCLYGKECVELQDRQGEYECQCPQLDSCDSFPSSKICASDWITYANECHMNITGCRESKVLTVLAKGDCKSYRVALKMSSTSASVISTTTSTPTTETTSRNPLSTRNPTTAPPTQTSTVSETVVDESNGSGDGNSFAPEDDEDGDGESSGNENDEEEVESTPAALATPESITTYAVKATFVSAGGEEFVYSNNLVSENPELYAQYKADIIEKIKSILSTIPKNGGVILPSIKITKMSVSAQNGMDVTLEMAISSSAAIIDVEDIMNQQLREGEIFTILKPGVQPLTKSLEYENDGFGDTTPSYLVKKTVLVKPIEPPTTDNPTYAEDGMWTVPQFGGSSYMEFNKMDAYSAATIEMVFKSSDSDGLLLYNGQSKGRDFISLAVINGYVEFRFDTGSGQLSLRSRVPVNNGRFHRVVCRRNRREGMLTVDTEPEIVGTSPSRTTGVNLDTSLFIGGYPALLEDKVRTQTSVSKGLTGCIKVIKVGQHGTKVLKLSSKNGESLNSLRIADCTPSPCMPNPCHYSSKCFITYQLEQFTFKCDCGPQYFGETCRNQTLKDSCASASCHESSTCVEDDQSYRCICPPSRTGLHCKTLVLDPTLSTPVDASYMPMFAGDSYIERPSLEGVGTRLDIEIVFYTYQLEGLLFYNSQLPSGEGDYVALNIRNGYLDFMYDLGSGAVHIVSTTKVALNKWHVAKLSRVMRIGDLTLDNNPIVKGESPNQHSQLNLGQPLYIGAVPESVTVPESTSITNGLMGAIQKFVVNGVTFPQSLVDKDSKSAHVRAFNGHPCFRKPCQNDGICIPELGNYTCQCKTGYEGLTCGTAKEVLDVEEMEQDPQGSLYLDGNVKALYNNYLTRKVHSFKSNQYEFQFKTTASEGLLFYNGKPSRRGDYIALAMNQGVLHLVYDLGSGPSSVASRILVNDGLWRNVKITRNEHKASIQIDDNPVVTVTGPPFAKWLNTDGVLWIGGCSHEYMPSRHRGVPKSFYTGYKGCIRRFLIDGQSLRLQEDVLNRPGFAMCQSR